MDRLEIKLKPEDKKAFKILAVVKGKTMTDLLIEFIQGQVAEANSNA